MNDNETMDLIRERMSGLDMTTPVETISTRGDTGRRRRRFARLGATGLVVMGLAVGVPAYTGSAPPAPQPTGPVHLVAFSVTRNPDGTATLRLPKQQVLDPAALQRALADAGVPAIVRIGSFCQNDQGGKVKIDRVMSSERTAGGTIVMVIDPAEMPADTELSIGYRPPSAPGRDRVRITLVHTAADLHCAALRCAAKTSRDPGRPGPSGVGPLRSRLLPPAVSAAAAHAVGPAGSAGRVR